MVRSITFHILCVYKMDGVVHDTSIEHRVKRHLPYAVGLENGGVHCVMKHCV